MQPTTKSDVYSFGVVLLQLVTGKQPIFHNPHSISVIQWTQKHLAQGDIEGVLDACMRGNHDVNSVWKATEVALQCTAHASAQRPTMTDVVAQLQECLGLEESRAGSEATESFYYNGGSDGPSMGYNAHVLADRSADELSLNNTFEIVHNFGMDAGPATR
jgi:serine/threonine protein kinase